MRVVRTCKIYIHGSPVSPIQHSEPISLETVSSLGVLALVEPHLGFHRATLAHDQLYAHPYRASGIWSPRRSRL